MRNAAKAEFERALKELCEKNLTQSCLGLRLTTQEIAKQLSEKLHCPITPVEVNRYLSTTPQGLYYANQGAVAVSFPGRLPAWAVDPAFPGSNKVKANVPVAVREPKTRQELVPLAVATGNPMLDAELAKTNAIMPSAIRGRRALEQVGSSAAQALAVKEAEIELKDMLLDAKQTTIDAQRDASSAQRETIDAQRQVIEMQRRLMRGDSASTSAFTEAKPTVAAARPFRINGNNGS